MCYRRVRGTVITISPIKGDYSNGYKVEGHADHGVHGEDIVCSAISALSQSCLLSLQRYESVEHHAESGLLNVEMTNKSGYTNLLINSMILGMKAIQHSYPQHVYIERENKTQKGNNLHDENAWI